MEILFSRLSLLSPIFKDRDIIFTAFNLVEHFSSLLDCLLVLRHLQDEGRALLVLLVDDSLLYSLLLSGQFPLCNLLVHLSAQVLLLHLSTAVLPRQVDFKLHHISSELILVLCSGLLEFTPLVEILHLNLRTIDLSECLVDIGVLEDVFLLFLFSLSTFEDVNHVPQSHPVVRLETVLLLYKRLEPSHFALRRLLLDRVVEHLFVFILCRLRLVNSTLFITVE